jgi:phosphatidylethanolamine/phosphatidyl-N-methylethanolamine N-methyltransferase
MTLLARWQQWRYAIWSPVYDLVVRPFAPARRRAIDLLNLQRGERVLIPGVGTGADLPLIPPGVDVTGTDLTPAMLRRARAHERPGVALRVMDAAALDFPDGSFDVVILNLILAVMAEPVRGLSEAARVLRPGGRMVVFDKFLADDATASLARRASNVVTSFLFTDINRRFGDILEAGGSGLEVLRQEEAGLHGLYRIVLLRKHA